MILDDARLYVAPGPNSYRVRIALAEKGIALPATELSYEKSEHRAPEFLALNSLGQVPVLQLADGMFVTESVAICRLIDAEHPEPALFGRDGREAALVEMWSRRVEQVVMATIGNVALHTDAFFEHRLTQFPDFAETERRAVPEKWAWLDREIADGRPYLAGGFFSMADIVGMSTSWLGEVFDMPIPDGLDNLRRWDERMRARPSWNA